MKKEKMSLDQLDSLKLSLEDKLKKLREELLEVEDEIQCRVMESKVSEFKELFKSHINQFCKFTRYKLHIIEVTLCKIKDIKYDVEENGWVLQVELIASYLYNDYHNEINFFTDDLDSIYEEQFLSGKIEDITFYESLNGIKEVLKSIVDEQIK